jgi:hypothetical protein
MALTLIEAAKRHSGNVLRSGVIELYAQNSDILSALGFENISGNAYSYNQEGTLPGVAFRGVNEGYSESTGIINPQTENLVIAGGDLDVDKFIVKTMGQDQRAAQEAMKVKALAHKIGYTFIKGDSVTNAKEFDGLQVRLTGSQLFDSTIGTVAAGGDPLELAALDQAIDAVDDPTNLLMSKAMRRRFTQAQRSQDTTTVGGHVEFTTDNWGRQVVMYAGLPILLADRNDQYYNTLAFNEASGHASPSGTDCTSIYVLSLNDGYLTGLQNDDMDVADLGEQDAKPVYRTRVEWYMAFAMLHPRSAARVRGITDAPIVA